MSGSTRNKTLLPPKIHGVPVLPGKFSDVTYQFAPLLTTRRDLFAWVSDHDVIPSIVWDDVVATDNTDEFELAFFIQYSRPEIPTAVGSVNVAADVPVNTKVLCEIVALVLVVNVVITLEKDPLTSSIEFGDVVPIPICDFA